MEYNDTMIFPSVTFCNLNQWRRSVLVPAVIDMISLIYSLRQEDRNDFNWTKLYEETEMPRGTMNLTKIALGEMGALNIDEMLIECVWNGAEECGPSNFTTQITDLGVCYTFNDPKEAEGGPHIVNKPGIDNGLTLTLDIAQYDYIAGDSQSAGIKVSLYYTNNY